jgi:phosphoglycerate dehydrogenase-like enzyme
MVEHNLIAVALDAAELPPAALARVKELAADRPLLVTADPARLRSERDRIEIIAGSVPVGLLLSAPHLRWYQKWSAGVDGLLRNPEIVEKDFVLTNTSGIHAIPIAEHVFGLMLAFARNFPEAFRAQARREWIVPARGSISELAGKTLLVVGLGGIGGHLAQVASAMGMRVLGVRRHPARPTPGVERIVGPDRLRDLLPEADFIVLAAPLTRETDALIGDAEFGRMRRSAFLVNAGRGQVVDEPALVRALQEKRIAGAGLDVFRDEPLPEASPLWTLPNVIITAHYSGVNPHYNERAMVIFVDNLQRYLSGRPLRNVVDKRLGY